MAENHLEILKQIRRIHISTKHVVNTLLAGAYHSAFKGQGIEFEDVREYVPGDDIRFIDWNVSARVGVPFVKNFREERELTVTIVADVSASMNFGSNKCEKKRIMAEIGALLAFSAIYNNDKVGLVIFSDEIKKYIPPQKGVKHGLRVIKELLSSNNSGKKTDLNVPLSFLGKIKRKSGIAFLISDFISNCDDNLLCLTAKMYDLIAIAISDTREFSLPNIGLARIRGLEEDDGGGGFIVDTSLPEVRQQWERDYCKKIDKYRKFMHKVNGGFIEIANSSSYVNEISKYFYERKRER